MWEWILIVGFLRNRIIICFLAKARVLIGQNYNFFWQWILIGECRSPLSTHPLSQSVPLSASLLWKIYMCVFWMRHNTQWIGDHLNGYQLTGYDLTLFNLRYYIWDNLSTKYTRYEGGNFYRNGWVAADNNSSDKLEDKLVNSSSRCE